MCLSTLVLSSCAKYKPQPLEIPYAEPQKKQGLAIQASLLNEKKSKRIFGGRSPRAKGYFPIQLTISNTTPERYKLDAAYIGLDLVCAHHVAHKLEFNTAGRVLGWSIAGLLLPIFFIPAIVEGVNASKANKSIEYDFDERTISYDSKLYIQPYGILNRIMFVDAENYKAAFDFDLISQETGLIKRFTVDIKE
jgi:hypothetical protein